jgi:hypothetical protein
VIAVRLSAAPVDYGRFDSRLLLALLVLLRSFVICRLLPCSCRHTADGTNSTVTHVTSSSRWWQLPISCCLSLSCFLMLLLLHCLVDHLQQLVPSGQPAAQLLLQGRQVRCTALKGPKAQHLPLILLLLLLLLLSTTLGTCYWQQQRQHPCRTTS